MKLANFKYFFLNFFLITLLACANKIIVPPVDIQPQTVRPPKIALVLGGGAARGFAHIGVIRVLEQEKIPIDMIVGTSVGSLIGAIYASHLNSFELEWTAFLLQKDDIFDFSIFSSKIGPIKGDKLEKFVDEHIKVKDIEKLMLPFIAVATDLNTGKAVLFDKGSISKAVRASSSIPGIFTPFNYQKRILVDGGVLGNISPEVARQYGADIIITVNISKNIVNYDTNNILSITLQAIDIMSNKIDQYKIKESDIIIEPDVGDVGTMDFSQKKKCMSEGIKAAQKAIPEIKKMISEYYNNQIKVQ